MCRQNEEVVTKQYRRDHFLLFNRLGWLAVLL